MTEGRCRKGLYIGFDTSGRNKPRRAALTAQTGRERSLACHCAQGYWLCVSYAITTGLLAPVRDKALYSEAHGLQ